MIKISNKLWVAIQLSGERRYILARKLGIHPTTFSQIINGMRPIRRGDMRIIRLGRYFGLEEKDLFENAGGNNEF